jgi:hypothetical protein
VSNIEVNNGGGVSLKGITTTQQTLKVSQPSVNVAVTGVVAPKDSHYTHKQNAVASEWTINHNLNKYPSVSVVNSADVVVYGEVTYVSKNQVRLNFSGAFSGKAFFN